MTTIEQYLKQDARLYPDKTALVVGDESLTYGELWRRVSECADALSNQTGRAVALRASQTAEFLVTYFALHLAGCIAVPLERDTPEETLQAIRESLRDRVLPPGTADILYTTGTTGRSKGVIISHRTIIADAENIIDAQGFCHDTVFVVCGPLNHIGSLSKLYPIIIMGGTVIVRDGMKDIDAFFSAFDYPSTCLATFLVPASIRILCSLYADRLAALATKIDFIETGAAAISHADMARLAELLPHSRLYNTYASTETGIVCTYNFNDGCQIAGCVGKPMRHARVFITPDGTIACQGPMLMSGYVGDDELTATVLRDGTLYTSDLGSLDPEGRLHITGRADDVINVGGYKVAPTEVEGAAMAIDGIADCVCVAARHPITGHIPKLLYTLKHGSTLTPRDIAQTLRRQLEGYKVPQSIEQVARIHRTFNGKIDRHYYHSEEQ